MRKFKVPYNYNFEEFTKNFIPLFKDSVHSIYFGPPAALAPSARPVTKPVTVGSVVDITNFCKNEGIDTYMTLNGDFIPINTYTSRYATKLASILGALDGKLTGIIIGNMYLPALTQLRTHAPNLKIIASVNSLVMDIPRAKALIDIVGVDGIIWDRSLNRDPVKLATINAELKKEYPKVTTQVMLNEGCLLHCPFKKAHDQAVSALTYVDDEYYEYLTNLGMKNPEMCNNAGSVNVNFGCQAIIKSKPELVNTIPDIDPCDLIKFSDCADLYKVSGRTHSVDWLIECMTSYTKGQGKLPSKFSDSGLKEVIKCI